MNRISRSVLILLLCSVIIHNNIYAQCGTVFTKEDIEFLKSIDNPLENSAANNYRDFAVTAVADIPIIFHIISSEETRTAVPSATTLQRYLDEMNEMYRRASIHFKQDGYVNYQIDQELAIHRAGLDLPILNSRFCKKNVVNIFIVDEFTIKGLNGYTRLPKDNEHQAIVVKKKALANGSTLAHEMGHFFGLFHTHGNYDGRHPIAPEPVDRNADYDKNGTMDCEETGDHCCDTPADPKMSDFSRLCELNICDFDIPATDENGQPYTPLMDNLMSYHPNSSCRNKLTDDQCFIVFQVARNQLEKFRFEDEKYQVSGGVHFTDIMGSTMHVDKDLNLFRFKESYQTGHQFSIAMENTSSDPLCLTIINMDISGKINKVYPLEKFNNKQCFEANERSSIDIVLSGTEGMEYTCFLYSRETIDGDHIAERMRKYNGTFTQKLDYAIGNEILPLENVNYNESDGVDFNATVNDEQIIPVIFEMEHQ